MVSEQSAGCASASNDTKDRRIEATVSTTMIDPMKNKDDGDHDNFCLVAQSIVTGRGMTRRGKLDRKTPVRLSARERDKRGVG